MRLRGETCTKRKGRQHSTYAAFIRPLVETTPFDRPRHQLDSRSLQAAFSWGAAKPVAAARSKAVNAAAIHLTSSNPNRGQTFKEAKRVSAPAPRNKRPRASTPTAAGAGAAKRSRADDEDDDDYTPGGSAAPAHGAGGHMGRAAAAAPSPRAPVVYTTPELSEEQKTIFTHLAHNPDIQLSEQQAKELAAGVQPRQDTLMAKLQPVFNKAVNELIKWNPPRQENYFKRKINAKWAREFAPDYLHRIANPMDLQRIRSRTTAKNPDDMYATLGEFETDVRLIFDNSAEYNGEDSFVSKAAAALVQKFYKIYGRMEKELAAATDEAKLSEAQRILISMRAEHIRNKQAAESSTPGTNAPTAAPPSSG
mgnify:CR=1 FL=1